MGIIPKMLHPASPVDKQRSSYEQKKFNLGFHSQEGVWEWGRPVCTWGVKKVLYLATGAEWNSLSSFI